MNMMSPFRINLAKRGPNTAIETSLPAAQARASGRLRLRTVVWTHPLFAQLTFLSLSNQCFEKRICVVYLIFYIASIYRVLLKVIEPTVYYYTYSM